jgi:hypothetical protein
MRKCLLVAGGVLALLGLFLFFIWPNDSISPASCERIQEGMTLSEVEVILSGPSGIYTSDRHDWSMGMLSGGLRRFGDRRLVWVADNGGIQVDFDQHGRVAGKQWCPRRSNLWDRMRGWLHL